MQSQFADFKAVADLFAATTDDEFEAGFRAVDTDGSGFIDKRELKQLLRKLYDREPSEYEHTLFLMHFDTNRDGRISLPEFRKGIADIRVTAEKNRPKPAKHEPLWKSAMESGPEVVNRGPIVSSHDVDVGRDGDGPATRPLIVGSGMGSTTHDLADGTSKRTMQLPGYSGHIPATDHNPHALGQALGDTQHDSFQTKTNIRQTFNTRTPGYTGFKPLYGRDAGRQEIVKPTGQFAATEQAAADSLIEQYWARRGGKA
jgi:hypothetical protein